MKSKERHELETNWLAQRLATGIEHVRPYSAMITVVALVMALAVLAASFYARSTAVRQREAWDAYNRAIGGGSPNLEDLRQAAELHVGTTMQHWADVTWADGQVFLAAQNYLTNRAAAIEALNRATGTYRSLLDMADDPRIRSRAQFGLGRVYELRGEVEQAREQYLAVRGEFEQLAQSRAEALAEPESKEVYDWLASAEAPQPIAPTGPGTPGQRPEFSAGELDLPTAVPDVPSQPTDGPAAPTTLPAADDGALDALFDGLDAPAEPADREPAEDEPESNEADEPPPESSSATPDP